MRKLGCFLFLIFLPLTAWADAYAPQWLKLLHYQTQNLGYLSVVDNNEFFLTANGRENPETEYEAAVALFNQKDDVKKCEFPARFMYLKGQGVVEGSLDDCKEYQQFLDDVKPKAVTMLFTDAYMNNPSSMFGHTLFRIDTKRKGTQLLAHGANFGADTGEDAGALYALKGLWGGYFGRFGVHPYYDVINLYNNIENRDIWEYQLNLTEDELTLFVAHLWEMQNAKIRYYFASKNCSYVLLLMLEAVKPELDISSQFANYTIPLETIKAVHEIDGLVKAVNYRPSRQSKLKYRYRQMNNEQKRVFKSIIRDNQIELESLKDEERADVLETGYQYVQYQYVEGSLELAEYRKKSFKLLQARSKIANQHQYFNELNEGKNPVLAHKSRQVSGGFGSRNGKFFQEIGFKPAYTSLLDDSYGLLKGAEINVFDMDFRHYDNKDKYVLQNLDVLHVKSLSGVDVMFSPFSFEITAAIRRQFNPRTQKDYIKGIVGLEAGQSYALNDDLLVYMMSGPSFAYSGELNDNTCFGFDVKAGIYYNHDKWRLNAEAKQNFATSYETRGQTYTVEAAYGFTRNLMFYTDYELVNTKWHDDETLMFGIKINF